MPKSSSSNKPPIYLRLMGGLGNQLFQYAAGRSLADRLGVELVLDDRYVVRKSHHTGLALDAFNVRARVMTAAERQLFSERKIRLARWIKKVDQSITYLKLLISFSRLSRSISCGEGTMNKHCRPQCSTLSTYFSTM